MRNLLRQRRVLVGLAVVVVLLVVGIVIAVTRDSGSSSAQHTSAHGESPTSGAPGSSTTVRGGSHATTTTSRPAGGSTSPTTGKTPSGGSTPGGSTGGGKSGTTTRATAPPDTTPPSVTAAYTDAFNAECRAIWNNAGSDGKFMDPDDPDTGIVYTISDCTSQLDPSSADSYDNVADAREAGTEDADSAVEDLTVGNRFITTAGRLYDIP